MSLAPLTSEPASIYAGDSISWKIALPDYPATDGWVLKYNAVGPAGRFALTSSADGSEHAVTATPATTALFTAGNYALVRYVENGSDTVTVDRLPLTVLPNLADATAASDTRTANEIMLESIDAALLGTASSSQKRVKLGDKEIEFHTRESLSAFRNNYALAVWQERNPGQLAPRITLNIRDRYGRD